MKLAALVGGTTADVPGEFIGDNGAAVPVRVRALDGIETMAVREQARAEAKRRGVEQPADGDPIYDLAVMAHTVAIAVLDADSPAEKREPFFDGGAAQAMRIRPEQVAHLFAQQTKHQEEASPAVRSLTHEEFAAGLATLGGEDEAEAVRFFTRCGPALQWTFARSLARTQFG